MKQTIETIWEKFSPQLKKFILSRVSDHSVAEDILQDVFIKVQSKIGSLKDPARIESWIYQITRNTIIDHYRTTKILAEVPQDLPVDNKTPDNMDCKTGYASIKAIIDTLPPPYAEALFLTEFEGLTQKEIAQKLNISHSGAKSRVQRARKMLKDKLQKCCRIEYDSHGTVVDYQCSEYFLSWFKKIS